MQTLGDNVNNDGGSSSYAGQYNALYKPNWGSFLNVTHAAEGNHDTYPPGGTASYFAYFRAAAGPRAAGYYSYNPNPFWHVIVLNAECSRAGGCAPGTPQYGWLARDLATNTRRCVMAVWHQPRWTSGRHSDDSTYASWWNLLYRYKVDLVFNGHNHNYERFNLIDPSERAAADGIREFIVGTGGAPGDGYSYASHRLDPNEAVRNQTAVYGVLKLNLFRNSYSWKFMPVPGYSFTDSGATRLPLTEQWLDIRENRSEPELRLAPVFRDGSSPIPPQPIFAQLLVIHLCTSTWIPIPFGSVQVPLRTST